MLDSNGTIPLSEGDDRLEGLPGAELVIAGLRDLDAGRITGPALLVLVASPNLRRLGVTLPEPPTVERPYEHRLYDLLVEQHGDGAHSRYNALIRRIMSFERALAWKARDGNTDI